MNGLNQVEEALHEALDHYYEVYFRRGDIRETLALVDRASSGAGTGAGEMAYTYDDVVRLYKQDIGQAPNEVHFEELSRVVTGLSPDTGVTFTCLNLETEIMKQRLKFNQLRLTIVWRRDQVDQIFKVVHLHASFPTNEHEADESYPVKELEERNRVLERLVQDRTRELELSLEQQRDAASTDRLTGLRNRASLEDLLEMEINRAAQKEAVFAVILMDMDHFKRINDTHGHQAGDSCLKELAELLIRQSRPTDIVGRWGGEEFLIICPNTDERESKDLAESFRLAVSAHRFTKTGAQTASFGVAVFMTGDDGETLIGRADRALYRAKGAGRNRVEV